MATKKQNAGFSAASLLSAAPVVAVATKGGDGATPKVPTALASLANQMLVNFSRTATAGETLHKSADIVDRATRYSAWRKLVDSITPAAADAIPVDYRGATGEAACACCGHSLGQASDAVLLANASGSVYRTHRACVERMGELAELLDSLA